MKKKIIFAAVAAVMGIGTYVVTQTTKTADSLTELQIVNAEALSDNEKDDCNYNNGYTAFTKSSGGAYDCCKIWVSKAPNTDEGHCR